jgi:YesN/AraC family two-component response regulator
VYKVILAQNGEEAIEKFLANKERIQLLLLDMIMPEKSGIEVYEEIKSIKPDTKVIFVSGYTADRMKSLQRNMLISYLSRCHLRIF